ncbi:MAG: ATP-binding cassette domain-containing protein, partial [Bacteroidales bacterium]|nr:ATP-binding cassette domain-containing protein [Bacteroidales bacterium]
TEAFDEERMRSAAATSAADVFVERLPQGYDTRLGKYFSHSEDLSMGQWQRVALARALYSKAPILVLDEPTSFMDAQSTHSFFDKLDEIAQNRIVLLITHSDEV